MDFVPAFRPPIDEDRPTLWFLFEKNRLLVSRDNGTYAIVEGEQLASSGINPVRKFFLGDLGDQACYAAELNPDDSIPPSFVWMDLRGLLDTISDEMFWIAGRANHLLDWDRSHRFCGRCNRPMEDKPDERAKHCPTCGLINYPRLSPAVIVAVVKGDKILLARGRQFRGPFYSVLAGFVEPGETLEQCVQREIREEVSLEVKNIRYFGSQPWPFPNSLMVGFIADYACGEIVVDNKELIEADWFSVQALPQVPSRISIASQLIDWFVKEQSQDK